MSRRSDSRERRTAMGYQGNGQHVCVEVVKQCLK